MYSKGYKPVHDAEVLIFGKAIHEALEKFYNGVTPEIIVQKQTGDEFTVVKLQELTRGYILRWQGLNLKPVKVEAEYSIPLVNPKTGAASRTWMLAGKVDVVLSDAIMEHKTTSEDVSDPTANYWSKLEIDPQISGYCVGAESLGFKPSKIIYDVISKPTMRPYKATPVESRKYTKAGDLYANQRDRDETPEEYRMRLRADITENPARYFQRKEIARLEEDLVDYLQDMWGIGKLIMESESEDYWPRRPRQCFMYGSRCPFFGVCAKTARLDDPELFKKEVNVNPELTEVI